MRSGSAERRVARGLAGALLAACWVAAGGCFARRIVIETEPTGAEVVINQRSVGRSPVAIQTADYGDLDLRIEAPGYAPVWQRLENRRPWYGYDPILFLLEVAPFPIHSNAVYRVQLAPQPPIDVKVLNQQAEKAAAEPLPPAH